MSSPKTEQLVDDWRQGKLWHDAAPRDLRRDFSQLDPADAWQRWSQYLADHTTSLWPDDLEFDSDPLDWGLPTAPEPLAAAAAWRQELDRTLGKSQPGEPLATQVAGLTERLHQTPEDLATAIEAVVAAYRLRDLAGALDAPTWWNLTTGLWSLSQDAQAVDADDLEPSAVLLATWLGGELPLVLSRHLADLKPFRQLRDTGRKALGEGLLAATDGEGLVDGCLLPVLPTLLASWTRARMIGEELKKNCWSSAAETQYEWLVRQVLRLSRPDGTPVLTGTAGATWPLEALEAALEIAGDDQDDAAAAARLGKVLPSMDNDYDEDDLPEPSAESEWSCLAVLANHWDRKASRLVVDYSQQEVGIEVEAAGRVLIAGRWGIDIAFNERPLTPVDDWEQQCWFCDDECDYLDLAIELTGGARLERQLLLGKDDDFLVVHDILHGPSDKAGEWQYTSRLPIDSKMEFRGEAETRDGVLVDHKGSVRASVLPLALAEWRVEPRFGELAQADSCLQLSQSATGARLSCPLWFDLQPRRATRPRTWRRLTVAASLEVAPSDVAVGYRAQCGDAQWLLYRSLAAPANRTVLGQNTAAEMLIGRFQRSGELDELLEVDPA